VFPMVPAGAGIDQVILGDQEPDAVEGEPKEREVVKA